MIGPSAGTFCSPITRTSVKKDDTAQLASRFWMMCTICGFDSGMMNSAAVDVISSKKKKKRISYTGQESAYIRFPARPALSQGAQHYAYGITTQTSLTPLYAVDTLLTSPNRNRGTRARTYDQIGSRAHLRAHDPVRTVVDILRTSIYTAGQCPASPRLNFRSDVSIRRCSHGCHRYRQHFGIARDSDRAIRGRGRSANLLCSRDVESNLQSIRLQ